MMAARQEPPGMPHVPDQRVDKHQARLEHVKVDLVAQDGAQPAQCLHVVEVDFRAARVLDQAVHAPDEDQTHARVQRGQHCCYVYGPDLGLGDAEVEEGREADEDDDKDELDAECGEREVAAQRLLLGRRGGVGGEGHAEGVEDLDNGHEAAECSQDFGRREGCAVGDVVEDAAEDMVVCEFEEGSGRQGVKNAAKTTGDLDLLTGRRR